MPADKGHARDTGLQDTAQYSVAAGPCVGTFVMKDSSDSQPRMKIVDKQKALSGGYPLKLIMEEIDKLKSLDHPAVLRLFAA